MSYHFRIPSSEPRPAIFKELSAAHRSLPDENAYLVWRGGAARGVYVFADEHGSTVVRLVAFSSDDDLALATDIVVGHARFFDQPIDAEDLPREFEFREANAPSAPPGYAGGPYFFTPEQLLAWPDDWYKEWRYIAYCYLSMLHFQGRPYTLLRGPHRSVILGPAVWERMQQYGAVDESNYVAANHREQSPLTDLLVNAQQHAALPLRPLFRLQVPIPRFKQLLKKLFSSSAKELGWYPPPGGLSLPPELRQEIVSLDAVPSPHKHFTVLLPGATYLLPLADYIALRPESGDWALFAFADCYEHLRRLDYTAMVDEVTLLVTMPDGEQWQALVAALRGKALTSVPHQDSFLLSADSVH